jgi:hypothetical protein
MINGGEAERRGGGIILLRGRCGITDIQIAVFAIIDVFVYNRHFPFMDCLGLHADAE